MTALDAGCWMLDTGRWIDLNPHSRHILNQKFRGSRCLSPLNRLLRLLVKSTCTLNYDSFFYCYQLPYDTGAVEDQRLYRNKTVRRNRILLCKQICPLCLQIKYSVYIWIIHRVQSYSLNCRFTAELYNFATDNSSWDTKYTYWEKSVTSKIEVKHDSNKSRASN